MINIYSPPRAHKDVFGPLFLKAQQLAQGQPLLILGDFNAHHRAWGYHYYSAKGRRLWDDWHTHQLTLITDVSYPTRLGTGLHRDTTPDLAFTSSGVKAIYLVPHSRKLWKRPLHARNCDTRAHEATYTAGSGDRLGLL